MKHEIEHSGTRDKEAGFSLLEIIVSITIISLLSTIVVMNVLPAQDQAMVRKAAADRITDLFTVLRGDPNRLPLRFRRRLERCPIDQVVGEYLAGMTDKFCDAQHQQLAGGGRGPMADW